MEQSSLNALAAAYASSLANSFYGAGAGGAGAAAAATMAALNGSNAAAAARHHFAGMSPFLSQPGPHQFFSPPPSTNPNSNGAAAVMANQLAGFRNDGQSPPNLHHLIGMPFWNPMSAWTPTANDYAAALMSGHLGSALKGMVDCNNGMSMDAGAKAMRNSFSAATTTPINDTNNCQSADSFNEALMKIATSAAHAKAAAANNNDFQQPVRAVKKSDSSQPSKSPVVASVQQPVSENHHQKSSSNGSSQKTKTTPSNNSNRSSPNSSTNDSSRSNLATLAEVACCLTPETQQRQQSQMTSPKSGQGVDVAKSNVNYNENAPNVAWAALASQLLAAAELQEIVTQKTGNKTNFGHENQTVDVKKAQPITTEKNNGNVMNNETNRSSKSSRSHKRRKIGNVSKPTPVVDCKPNSIEDTIDCVIRLHREQNLSPPSTTPVCDRKVATTPSQPGNEVSVRKAKSGHHQPPPAAHVHHAERNSTVVSNHTSCGSDAPVQKVQAPKENTSVANSTDGILDLSMKKRKNFASTAGVAGGSHQQQLCRGSGVATTSSEGISGITQKSTPSGQQPPLKKIALLPAATTAAPAVSSTAPSASLSAAPTSRRTVDASLVRLPLARGWRRQTCVRSVSSTGIRGDVLYYSPCGRKFASVAEISRYLKKQSQDVLIGIGLPVDYFTFSSKVIVGEFFYATPEGIKNISEEDILSMIQSIRRSNGQQKQSVKRQILTGVTSDISSFASAHLSALSHQSSYGMNNNAGSNPNQSRNANHCDAGAANTVPGSEQVPDFAPDDQDEIEEAVAGCIIDLITFAAINSSQ